MQRPRQVAVCNTQPMPIGLVPALRRMHVDVLAPPFHSLPPSNINPSSEAGYETHKMAMSTLLHEEKFPQAQSNRKGKQVNAFGEEVSLPGLLPSWLMMAAAEGEEDQSRLCPTPMWPGKLWLNVAELAGKLLPWADL